MKKVDKPNHIHTFAVDADIIAYRCAAVCEEEDIKVLCETIDDFIYNIVRETDINRLAFFLSDETNFRYKAARTKPYKANRDKIIRPRHIFNANSYLKEMYRAQIINDFEADDAVASYMTQHENVAHAGIDKDIKQIAGYHYDVVKRVWLYTSEERSRLLVYRQVCQGDSSDNIPGLPGIGVAKAAKAVTDSYRAHEEALELYEKVMKEKNMLITKTKEEQQKEILEYFTEQKNLITIIDSIEIPYEVYTVVEPPKIFEPSDDPEDDFISVDEEQPKPKLELT